ncbi:hypothetical protein FEM48_Zijuj01G0108600 [Ziziphus jujuba var. spinosa]|uniref:Alpha N-terminal protein methyltransferase 1 n=1 Tax=Ziziphus jujuba var. spinosa TaxID=714518 RepID=A0A978W0U7_ZIZJJ|nr:hypothetical protein FEM48_Zijuj01G0108600 [Ziziphus jujuba var. spinosa]
MFYNIRIMEDCGSGIGRVTKNLLIRFFNEVDLLEPVSHFLETARESLAPEKLMASDMHKATNFFCVPLQEFTPDAGRYDVIWVQWCIGHLTDDDFVSFFKRAKDNIASLEGETFEVLSFDSVVVVERTKDEFKDYSCDLDYQIPGTLTIDYQIPGTLTIYPQGFITLSTYSIHFPLFLQLFSYTISTFLLVIEVDKLMIGEALNDDNGIVGLKPGGIFVLKENIARSGFVLDNVDRSITRSDSYFKDLFRQCGLHLYKSKDQKGFPEELFAVKMYALTTDLPKRVHNTRSKGHRNRPGIIK